jgi:hypothetical protein
MNAGHIRITLLVDILIFNNMAVILKISDVQRALTEGEYIKLGEGRIIEIEETSTKFIASLTIADSSGELNYYNNIHMASGDEIILNKKTWKIIQDVSLGKTIQIKRISCGNEFIDKEKEQANLLIEGKLKSIESAREFWKSDYSQRESLGYGLGSAERLLEGLGLGLRRSIITKRTLIIELEEHEKPIIMTYDDRDSTYVINFISNG